MLEIGCILMRFLRIDHCDKEIIDYGKSYRIMGCIGLFSIIINLPMFWSFNWDSDLCELSDLYRNETFSLLALTLPHTIIRFILPTIFLIYVNFFTLKEVRNWFNFLKNSCTVWNVIQYQKSSRIALELIRNVDAICFFLLKSWKIEDTGVFYNLSH